MQILLIDVARKHFPIYMFLLNHACINFSKGKISWKEETWFIYTNTLGTLASSSRIQCFRDKRGGYRRLELDKDLGSVDRTALNLLYPFFPTLPMDPELDTKVF